MYAKTNKINGKSKNRIEARIAEQTMEETEGIEEVAEAEERD